mmetsp:Transcript_4898/g.13659  ORF Transcript_4898/g.13659 Transcript_4898/m.13659 type:complete len:455 (-) Transcript_4898:81-1445(-)|eukprot:CAMPEP_0117670692 /NCGR_PEP_ID=MMETSP0804-20121206/12914_1 /TAXON_ID=1074897 /ORGANISM="Tetraselmis astigmatica, Strain CCMP880" /LENGTH=454 /DNA_ID=CAMNT_0005479059 /DNA_START=55 /DNA_END=1419 /DNA_ORIENTATION=-
MFPLAISGLPAGCALLSHDARRSSAGSAGPPRRQGGVAPARRRLVAASAAARESAFLDYYLLLNVTEDSDLNEIKKAYRFLQKRCHPDISGHDQGHAMAVLLNEAYATLQDPKARASFDMARRKHLLDDGYTGTPLSSWAGPPDETRALFVDEGACVGCLKCALEAKNTFAVEMRFGRARCVKQWGDAEHKIEDAISVCPVNCIHWVDRKDLPPLEHVMRRRAPGSDSMDPFYAAARFLQQRESAAWDPVSSSQQAAKSMAQSTVAMAMSSIMSRGSGGSSSWWHAVTGGWKGRPEDHQTGALVRYAGNESSAHLGGVADGISEDVLDYLLQAAQKRAQRAHSNPYAMAFTDTLVADDEEYWVRPPSPRRSPPPARKPAHGPNLTEETNRLHELRQQQTPGPSSERNAGTSRMVLLGIVAALLLHNLQLGPSARPQTPQECFQQGGGLCRLYMK